MVINDYHAGFASLEQLSLRRQLPRVWGLILRRANGLGSPVAVAAWRLRVRALFKGKTAETLAGKDICLGLEGGEDWSNSAVKGLWKTAPRCLPCKQSRTYRTCTRVHSNLDSSSSHILRIARLNNTLTSRLHTNASLHVATVALLHSRRSAGKVLKQRRLRSWPDSCSRTCSNIKYC